ncbi:MAG: hypothetical protein ABUL73_03560 [Alphaproteobacteria bacterium]
MITFLTWGLFTALFALAAAALVGCRSRDRFITIAIMAGAVGGVVGWVNRPTLDIMYLATWAFAIGGAFFGALLGNPSAHQRERFLTAYKIAFAGAAVLGALFLVTTHGIFHAQDYRRLLGTPKDAGVFVQDLAAIDTTRLRVVNQDYATAIADKLLGDQAGLGSEAALGAMQISQLNGCFDATVVGATAPTHVCFDHELVWVAPLVHNGFFRWLTNHVTHEYVIVSAIDPARKLLVGSVGGHAVSLRYHLQGAHFGDDLMRHLRENGYLNRGLTDVNFELDDAGRPWWVVVTFVKRVGFRGEDPDGVLLVDPETGAITRYPLGHVPAWVDRIEPEAIVSNQFDNWGKYGLGWWNSWTARANVVQTSTYALHLVEGVDGRTYWYTGIASIGADQSTTGFVLVDTKTKETRIYHIPGAMEDAAQRSAQNVPGAKERQYQAGEPILYNLGGAPTYFMTLSGDDRIPRMYAFVSVRDYQIVGASESVVEALHRYQTALRARGPAAFNQSTSATETVTGEIQRIAEDPDGKGRWLLLRTGSASAEYFVSSGLSPELKFAAVGDHVRVAYEPGDASETPFVTSFDDLDVSIGGK